MGVGAPSEPPGCGSGWIGSTTRQPYIYSTAEQRERESTADDLIGAFRLQEPFRTYYGGVPAGAGKSHLGDFMFTRNSSVEPRPFRTTAPTSTNSAESSISAPSTGEKSVIGNDLKIVGQGLRIISRGVLQVDGEIEGDVLAAEIIVGEKGNVTGMVAGQQVVIRGTVSGVVCGKSVALQASSQVDGDVHHLSFAIEQGAQFEGRSRRAKGEPDLLAVVEQRPGSGSA